MTDPLSSRLEHALTAFLAWKSDDPRATEQEFLAANEELRDLLEPMLDDDEPSSDGADSGRLGDFRIIREIGRGGMGVVYEAQQISLVRRVALKVLPAHLTLQPETIARFLREVTTAARMQHPGIVEVYAIVSEADTHSFAMEFIEGAPLDAVLEHLEAKPAHQLTTEDLEAAVDASCLHPSRAGDPPAAHLKGTYLQQIVDWMAQVADALEFAHRHGVIHRDVKPSNILVRPDGRVVLTDFGLARAEGLPSMTRTGTFAGTPYYTAPEQSRGASNVDHRADVFSAGATLYELVTCQRPFAGDTTQQVLAHIVNREPDDPAQHHAGLSEDLAAVILKALEKEPHRRYQSAAEFAEDLRAFLTLRPVSARRASRWTMLGRWCQRQPALAATLALLAIALLTGLTASLWLYALADGHLQDYKRLADGRILMDLRAEAGFLAPARPENARRMRDWLDEAEELVHRLPVHRERLEQLRERASPYDDEQRARDRRSHEDWSELSFVRELIARGLGETPGVRPLTDDEWQQRLPQLQARERELTARVDTIRTWAFERDEDQWQHDLLETLVAELETFAGPEGEIEEIQHMLALSSVIQERSVGAHADAWNTALAALREDPRYGGITFDEQVGLVPIGKDPHTGLLEFVDIQTGDVPARNAETGEIIVTGTMGVVFVLLPGGRFEMGSLSIAPFAKARELPRHELVLAPFFMSKYEMTQGQWEHAFGDNPSHEVFLPPGATRDFSVHAVQSVNWLDCMRAMHRLGFVLPTEAQWEYAARGGTEHSWWFGEDVGRLDQHANFADRSVADMGLQWPQANLEMFDGWPGHAPVGTFPPNPFGLHEVNGNIAEWVREYYGSYDQPTRSGDCERIIFGVDYAIVRGGSFSSHYETTRSAARAPNLRTNKTQSYGVRPARIIE